MDIWIITIPYCIYYQFCLHLYIEAEWRIYASLTSAIIGSDNGLSPVRRSAIIWTNAGILLIGPLGTIFSEISIGIETFSFKKMHLKMSSAKWRPSCLGLNMLNRYKWKVSICVHTWFSFMLKFLCCEIYYVSIINPLWLSDAIWPQRSPYCRYY